MLSCAVDIKDSPERNNMFVSHKGGFQYAGNFFGLG